MKYSTMGINFYVDCEVPVIVKETKYCDENIVDRFRLIFISKGSGIIETIEGFSPFIAPTLCCVNETETIKIQSTQKIETIELIFHPEFLNPSFDYHSIRLKPKVYVAGDPQEAAWLNAFTQRLSKYKGIMNIYSGISNRIEIILRQINKELLDQRDWYWPCRTRSFLLELLLVVDRIFVEPLTDEAITITEKYKSMNEIIMYLTNHYPEKILLSQITEKFNINRTSLNDYFKEATGHTVMSYLIHLRIHLAMAMLKDTALQVSEIMFRVGYINTSHFIRAFKKTTGMSPSEYREIHTWLYK
ncbi:MAG: helix-turn-helix domain-containing protein [Desulfitobacteriaceae bacterium]